MKFQFQTDFQPKTSHYRSSGITREPRDKDATTQLPARKLRASGLRRSHIADRPTRCARPRPVLMRCRGKPAALRPTRPRSTPGAARTALRGRAAVAPPQSPGRSHAPAPRVSARARLLRRPALPSPPQAPLWPLPVSGCGRRSVSWSVRRARPDGSAWLAPCRRLAWSVVGRYGAPRAPSLPQ